VVVVVVVEAEAAAAKVKIKIKCGFRVHHTADPKGSLQYPRDTNNWTLFPEDK